MQELSGKSIEEVNLYWVNLDLIGVKATHRYVIDIETRQLYSYEPEEIYGQMWHTLDGGVEANVKPETMTEDEIWDGWITLTLYYPVGSTARQWRLGAEGETRYDKNLSWQDYTGPITVRISDVENVWIKYKLGDEEVIIPPNGRVLVDIQPDSWYLKSEGSLKVKIAYDENAVLKEYKIGNSTWQEYTEEFTVTESVLIEARAKVVDKLVDSEGNIVGEQERWGRDSVFIKNEKIEESDLEAPTIKRKAGVETGEVAKVEITYPEGAAKKVYKINYGVEVEYTEEIGVTTYGTHIIAYYYDATGKRSNATEIVIDEKGSGPVAYIPPSTPPTPSYEVKAPIISASPTSVVTTESGVMVSVSIPSGYAANKTYLKTGNNSYQEYTGPVNIKQNTTVYAYYMTLNGERSSTATKRINNIKEPNKPYVRLDANPDPYVQKYNATEVKVSLYTEDATTVEYSLNGIEYTTYTEEITVTKNCRVYGRATNANGTTVEYIDITNIEAAPEPAQKLTVVINADPEPELTAETVDKAKVSIEYDSRATKKYYKIGYNGTLQEYTGEFEVEKNCTIYAYAVSDKGKGQTSKRIDNLNSGIAEPEIAANPTSGKQAGKVSVKINYDKNATTMRYKIDGGTYTDYTGAFDIEENCTIYAYNTNTKGERAESSYTINNIVAETPVVVIDKGDS